MEKLYYLDSHMAEFSARVLSCRAAGEGFDLALDRTAFFPGGGGQAPDTGYIGGVRVTDVCERDGEILHRCSAPLTVGESYDCRLDFQQRLRRMQDHSGEHIVSGLVHKLRGFDNVGFHMGGEGMTIDFDGELSEEDLLRIENLANEAVRADLPVTAGFPDPETLRTMVYRSKLELTENVRIVEIEGIDRCACCAPHVKRTGEIGLVKLLDSERHRGGTRLTLVCGMDALDHCRAEHESVAAISRALSAKRGEVVPAVERMLAEQQRMKERSVLLEGELIRRMAETVEETAGSVCLFDALLEEPAQRELVNLLMEKCGGLAAVFCGEDRGEGWRYIIGSRSLDLRVHGKRLNELMDGRGGGKAQMIQGRAQADRAEIEKIITTYCLDKSKEFA